MPRPRKPELTASRIAFNALKPLPPYYGIRVNDHYPHIDLPTLYKAVAGRIAYEEGLAALTQIVKLYPAKQARKEISTLANV